MKSDKVTIVWSGGLDSTALILKALKDRRPFDTVSLNLTHNNEGVVSYDKIARTALTSLINLRMPKECKDLWIYHNDHELPAVSMTGYALTQQPIFVSCAAWLSSTDTVWMGFVKGDDFWHYKTQALQLWEANTAFHNKDEHHASSPSKLEFPFEWNTKRELLDTYYSECPDLLQYVTVSQYGHSWLTDDCNKSLELRKLVSEWKLVIVKETILISNKDEAVGEVKPEVVFSSTEAVST